MTTMTNPTPDEAVLKTAGALRIEGSAGDVTQVSRELGLPTDVVAESFDRLADEGYVMEPADS